MIRYDSFSEIPQLSDSGRTSWTVRTAKLMYREEEKMWNEHTTRAIGEATRSVHLCSTDRYMENVHFGLFSSAWSHACTAADCAERMSGVLLWRVSPVRFVSATIDSGRAVSWFLLSQSVFKPVS